MIELKCESIWFEQRKYEEAESLFYRSQSGTCVNTASQGSQPSSIVDQITKARETIQQTLKGVGGPTGGSVDENVVKRLSSLENENQQLNENIKNVKSKLAELEKRIAAIEISEGDQSSAPKETLPVSKSEIKDDDDDDEDDLFGSDDDAEVKKLKEIRMAEYSAKKAKKPAVIAKSNIILDVKPWDDETDMAVVEEKVRSVTFEGLLWGTSKLVPVGYGIKKLQINCVVEDDKVGTDDLEEAITAFEDLIQSMDIVAFNKV